MYFSPPTDGAEFQLPTPPVSVPITQTTVTVLTSRPHSTSKQIPLMQKKFWINDSGELAELAFQNGFFYDVETPSVGNILEFGRLIEETSRDPRKIIIRGLSRTGQLQKVRKMLEEFEEPLQGIPWVMLDFDHISLPEGMDPNTVEAIEFVIAKLPDEFHGVTYYYQFSNSAGIIKPDGTPRKTGFNGHVFFWLDHPVHGKQLTAYLKLHCLDTGFYEIGEDKGGHVRPCCGVDPALTNSAVQAHYTAAPDIGTGVTCVLAPENRQGLITKGSDQVVIPILAKDIVSTTGRLHSKLVNEYKKAHGYQRVLTQSKVGNGIASIWHYANPSTNSGIGRTFIRGKVSLDGQYFTLFFDDENSPGSWFVSKNKPEFARHFGDDVALLKELSLGAHAYVRDQLKWFTEVPHQRLALTERGYLPPLTTFANAKVSLILAPTGSGKTKAAIDWCNWRYHQEGTIALMIYAAPTISLVDQMLGDLKDSGLLYYKYTDVWPRKLPSVGVIVTTNKSLGRILKLVYEANTPYYLILDEIHQGLDEFMKTNRMNKVLEDSLVKSTQALLLTGTLTDVQRTKIPEVVGHALSGLTEAHYCTYEFAPVKRNPITIRPTNHFDSDFMRLMEDLSAMLKAGEALPRVVILLDTSKLNAYRSMLAQHGLTEYSHVVSRPENTEEQIEEARVSQLPILIASPLFALGLNFDRAPEILLCRFSGISADTSQVIQAVNRGNRNQDQCQVIIYGNPKKGTEFRIPPKAKLKTEVATYLKSESSLTGLLEDHFHVDRITYQVLRDSEKNSHVALSHLVEHDLIQNYTVTAEEEIHAFDRKKAAVFKEQKKASRAGYLRAISEKGDLFAGREAYLCFWKLERLALERRENFRSDDPRIEREIKNEELGAVMGLCNLKEPQAASKVNIGKVRRLFGELSPWISAQYNREDFQDWAKVEAEKTEKLVVLLEKLNELKTGRTSATGLASSLTRNQKLVDAFKALASNDADYVTLVTKFNTLKKAREATRSGGSKKAKDNVQESGLRLLHGLLEALGVAYGKKKNAKERSIVDYEAPIVPATWNLPEMALNLTRQAIRLSALPIDQKVAVVSEDDFDRLHPGEPIVPLRICHGCVYFHQNSCVLGRQVAWQGDDYELNLAESCPDFRGEKARLIA